MQNYMYITALVWFVCAGTCGIIAEDRGRNGIGWFLLGMLFSFFALVAVCALSCKEKPSKTDDARALHQKTPRGTDGDNLSRAEPEPQWRTIRRTSPHLTALIAEGEKNAANWASSIAKPADQ